MLFSRQLGGFMSSKKKNGSAPLLNYSEMEESCNESFYEEIIVDDDGEEYIEEIIEDDEEDGDGGGKALSDLRATQEQVDSMSLQNAKQYLLALPQAKGPTSVPVAMSDEDYEYEEIEIVDAITPIRRSRRSTFFVPPALDDILEESEHTERSVASSIMHSPNVNKHKQAMPRNLSNITEGLECSQNCNDEVLPKTPLTGNDDPIVATPESQEERQQEHDSNGETREAGPGSKIAQDPDGDRIDEMAKEKILAATTSDSDDPSTKDKVFVGELNDTTPRNSHSSTHEDPDSFTPIVKPSISNRSINRSNKSIQSESTETTMSESGSNTSLDIRQIFGLVTPPGSPHNVPVSQTRRVGIPTDTTSTSNSNTELSLGKNLNRLGETGQSSGRGSGRRREDADNQSVMSSRSRRSSKRTSSGRVSSSSSSSKIPNVRAQTVEAEILALLSPDSNKQKSRLDDMLSSATSSTPKQHRDSDDHSLSARSVGSRRRSSRVAPSEISLSTPKHAHGEDHHTEMPSHGRSSRSTESLSKEKSSTASTSKSLKKGSKSLDALLARLPAEPQKRSDARSTASALIRSSRGRTRDNDRDCRSVVGCTSTTTGSNKAPRARSARRVKRGDGDDVSVASMPAASSSNRPRARSTSIGRKERLRRSRRQEETERANRKFQEEMKKSKPPPPTTPPTTKSKAGSPKLEGRKTPDSHRGQVRRKSGSREMDDMPSSYRSEKEEKPSSSSSRRGGEKEDGSSSSRRSSRTETTRHGSTRESSFRSNRMEDDILGLGESRGSITSSRSKSRTRGEKEEGHSKHSHSTSTRSSTRRSHTTTGSASHSKGSHSERRSSRQSEDTMDEMDGNASFHRTLLLARSLHSTTDDGSVGNDTKSPRRSSGRKENHDASPKNTESNREPRTERRSSSEEHQIPRPSRRSSELADGRNGQLRKSDTAIAAHAMHDFEKPKMRLSDVASAMRDIPKPSKSPREYHPEPLKKKHSSDDILLMSPDDQDATRTPSGREHRTLPSRSHSNRTPGGSRQERRVPYHSPPQSKKKYLVSPTSEERSRTHLSRSRSEGMYKSESPTKMVQARHQHRRTSELQPISPMTSSPTTHHGSSPAAKGDRPVRRNSIDVHSPSTSLSPAITPARAARRRSSMDMPSPSSASSSTTSHRHSSMDMRSPLPPLAPSLGGGPPTPFERLSELEKIKQFLTDEEYEQKKKEILASI